MEQDVTRAYRLLKWTYGLVPIAAGLDKFARESGKVHEFRGNPARVYG